MEVFDLIDKEVLKFLVNDIQFNVMASEWPLKNKGGV